MKSEFSLEIVAERIFDSRTRSLFDEVLGCYSSGFYRSAIVMLWSVAVTDILFKLEQSESVYGDTRARRILDQTESKRQGNPKSPEWEWFLVEKVAVETDLLGVADLTFLQQLRDHRNLCAHPVIHAADVLFSPNRETARAHIRNILEAVLTKPPMMSRKVFDVFIEDVERLREMNIDRERLTKFLRIRYFRHFSDSTFIQIFKSLWRVTFKTVDWRAESNRDINLLALLILFEARPLILRSEIEKHGNWFSDISLNPSCLGTLEDFLNENPMVYPMLNDAVRAPLIQRSNVDLEKYVGSWFLAEDQSVYLSTAVERIRDGERMSGPSFAKVVAALTDSDLIGALLHLGIEMYLNSRSFKAADENFEAFIRPYLTRFEFNHFKALLEGCERCYQYQATARRSSRIDHQEVLSELLARGFDIDLLSFPAFSRSLGENVSNPN